MARAKGRDMAQARIAGKWTGWVQRGLAALLCLCFVCWSFLPVRSHIPDALAAIQDHGEIIESHGHSHGFEKDLAWALHGHSHDVADHDHSPVLLVRGAFSEAPDIPEAAVSAAGPSWRPGPVFLNKRPPRVWMS